MERVSDEWLSEMVKLYSVICSSEGNIQLYRALFELKLRREVEGTVEGAIDMSGVVDEWLDDVLSSVDASELVRRSYTSVRQALIELQARRKVEKDGAVAAQEKPVLPIPCTKGFEEWSIKDYFQKINEELDELKEEVLWFRKKRNKEMIADEAADTITAIASMLEAMGIDEKARQAAQERVNERNRQRGRW